MKKPNSKLNPLIDRRKEPSLSVTDHDPTAKNHTLLIVPAMGETRSEKRLTLAGAMQKGNQQPHCMCIVLVGNRPIMWRQADRTEWYGKNGNQLNNMKGPHEKART